MILTPDPFLRWFEPIQALRRRRVPGYLAAVAGVALAILLRLMLANLHQPPFTTFYPVILLAALLGGARAGGLALALSALSAHVLMTAPIYRFPLDGNALVATGAFVVAAGLQVALVVLLNHAVDRISAQAEESKLILEAQPIGVMLVNGKGVIIFVNAQLENEVGYTRQELCGQPVEMLVPDALRTSHTEARRLYLTDPQSRSMGAGRKLYARRKDGSMFPVEVGLAPFRRPGFSGALATVVDVSERETLERREVIANEVRHRARNVLTVVQALARRTLPRDEHAAFAGMLQTIARTQEVLSDQATASLHAIIEGELGELAHQIAVEGCDLRLSPRSAQDFAMIVHELTTNAIKYGALSRPEGRVEIACQLETDGRSFTFAWKERGGPEVSPPERRGFGSTILKDLALGFAVSVDADYAPGGLRYELRAELARIGEVADTAEIATPA